MTLDAMLPKLSDWRPDNDGRHVFTHHDDAMGAAVHLTVDRQESLGCQLWEVAVTRAPASMPSDTLVGWAKRIAARVTGLLEPLQLLEADETHGMALLRSNKPAARDEDLYYYEVVLTKAGSATVRRYRGSKQPVQREQVGFTLTHEAVAKLAGDLAAAQ